MALSLLSVELATCNLAHILAAAGYTVRCGLNNSTMTKHTCGTLIKHCKTRQEKGTIFHKFCRKAIVMHSFATIMKLHGRDAYQLGKLISQGQRLLRNDGRIDLSQEFHRFSQHLKRNSKE